MKEPQSALTLYILAADLYNCTLFMAFMGSTALFLYILSMYVCSYTAGAVLQVVIIGGLLQNISFRLMTEQTMKITDPLNIHPLICS